MINQQLGIDAKQLIQQSFTAELIGICQRTASNIPHCHQPVGFQFFRISPADPPEISQWTMGPALPAVAHLVKLRNARSVLIGFNMLGNDIHRHLGQIQIRADPHRCGNTRCPQHIQDDLFRQFPAAQT